jgi:hypothetical protein
MNNNNWKVCFEQFHAMSDLAQHALRRCAADHLVARGFEEVGSSDVSHELFAMWRYADNNWNKAFIIEVNAFADA